MSRLLKLLHLKPFSLIVSLPENQPELAAAAVRGGADALKVHLHIEHQAAKTRFGRFADEKDRLIPILQNSRIPVGVVPGDDQHFPDEKEYGEIAQAGFDFFDMRFSAIPPWMWESNGMAKVAAVDQDYSLEGIMDFSEKKIDAVEAAIVPHSEYGKSLTVGDLQQYNNIAVASNLPIIVPSQRRVSVRDLPFLADTGVKALMIGVIVTGRTAESIEEATRAFRQAIDDLDSSA